MYQMMRRSTFQLLCWLKSRNHRMEGRNRFAHDAHYMNYQHFIGDPNKLYFFFQELTTIVLVTINAASVRYTYRL